MVATASAVKEGLLSLSSREIGGFRSAAEAAKDMMQEASPNKLHYLPVATRSYFLPSCNQAINVKVFRKRIAAPGALSSKHIIGLGKPSNSRNECCVISSFKPRRCIVLHAHHSLN